MQKLLTTITLIIFLSSKIYTQEISSFPGLFGLKYYVDDKEVKLKEINQLITKNKEANLLWEKAKKQNKLYQGITFVQTGLAIVGVYNIYEGNTTKGLTYSYASLGVGVGSLILANAMLKNRRNAILTYNSSFDKKSSYHFSSSNQGLGLCMNF